MKNDKLEFQRNIIKSDFGVEILFENQQQMLFYKLDNVFLKFVFNQAIDNYSQLSQFYILRYEIVKCMDDFFKSNKEQNTFTLTTGVIAGFNIKNKLIEISLKHEASSDAITISSDNKAFYEIINGDYAVLQSIKSSPAKDLVMGVWKILRFDRDNTQIRETITATDLEILQFEKQILSSRTTKNCLTGIYRLMLKSEAINTNWLKESLMENFEWTYTTTSCDCGSDGCFFSILKENLEYFFTNNYSKGGKFDKNLVLSDFDTIWDNFTLKQKAALGFLYSEFYNSTLLNLAFLKPDFKLSEYLYLMCQPYQPDSEDEEFVRTVSNLAYFFIQNCKK